MKKPRPCALCHVRPRTPSIIGPDLCDPCAEYSGYENQHCDDGHEDAPVDSDLAREYTETCPICRRDSIPWENPKEPDMKTTKKNRKVTANPTTKQVHVSHAGCSHPKTPKARAACRKLRRTPVVPIADVLAVAKEQFMNADPAVFGAATDHVNAGPCGDPDCEVHEPEARAEAEGTDVGQFTHLHMRATGSKVIHLAQAADPITGIHLPACPAKIKNAEGAEVFILTAPSPTCKTCLKIVAHANA